MSTLYDWSFAERLQCSESDRRQCLAVVSEIVDLAAKARRYGLLSLVEAIEGERHFLLIKGLHLIVDGVKPDVVRRILETYILSDNCRGKELLTRCLILEGVAGIQNAANPKNIKEMLLSFFGSKGPALYAETFNVENDPGLDQLLNGLGTTADSQLPATSLNTALGGLTDREIQECLKEVSTHDLAEAVQCMDGRIQLRIFKNLSQRGADYLQTVLTQMDPVANSDMLAAQEKIHSIIEDLKSRGIVGTRKRSAQKRQFIQGDQAPGS